MTAQSGTPTIFMSSIKDRAGRLASGNWPAMFHYVLASVAFVIYGIQVCPLLERLSPLLLGFPIIGAAVVRSVLTYRLDNLPYDRQVIGQFRMDYFLFLAAGGTLVAINTLLFDAPWHSNLKVMTGMAILGLFVAIDLALGRERQVSEGLIRTGAEVDAVRRCTSFSHKFILMATLVVVSISVVIFLVINKDLEWLLSRGPQAITDQARDSIMGEVAFVMVVMLAYSMRIIYSYVQNLKMYFSHQNGVLAAVLEGDLSERVPVTSQDEFGLMARSTNAMIASLQRNREKLILTRDASILALASLAETRDNETGAHILRTQYYVRELALQLSHHPDFRNELNNNQIEMLYKSAPLHDIGKVGIPDKILLKPGRLDEAEFEIMKTHASLGADALSVAEKRLGSNSFMSTAREIAGGHHEKWDGSGYPLGLAGDAIPLSARLMALADVYDALISKRVYKEAFSHQTAREIICKGSGSHFDPRVVQAFLERENAFQIIAQTYQDNSDNQHK